MRWLTAFLALLVLILLALLFLVFFCRGTFCHYERLWFPKLHCGICALSPEGDAHLGVGQPGVSIWSNGTVAVAVPVENKGTRGAGDVRVNDVELGAGTRILPASLPVFLGEISPRRRGVVQTEFTALTVPGNYTLTVSGTYLDSGETRPFVATAPLTLRPRITGPIASVPGIVTKQHTSGTPTAPSPVRREGDENNPVGPPVPLGPRLTPFSVAPTGTPVSHAPPPGQSAAGITFQRNTGSNNSITNAPPDPSTTVDTGAGVVVDTDNTIMEFSTTDGQSFTQLDPTTIFPQSDGGMCCDQVVLYDAHDDLIFWLQQYNAAPGAGTTNRERVAWASPESLKNNVNAWTYIDLTPQGFNSGGNLDYPDLALSGSYLYVSVDGADTNGKAGLIVTRLSLADIVGSGSNVGLSFFGPNQSTDQYQAHGSHLSQNSSDGAYWAGSVDSSDMEIFHWPDSSGDITPNVTAINNWCTSATDYTNLPPDKMQWPDTGHLGGAGNIVGVTRVPGTGGAHGQVWFGWGAGADGTDCSQTGRPLPFVKIVKVDDVTLNSVGEYHIWNSQYGFSYPAFGTDPSGNIGVSVAFAGPNDFPSTSVGYLGDYVVYYVEASNVSLKFYTIQSSGNFTFINPGDGSLETNSDGTPTVFTRYGDYFSVRNSGPRGTLFSNQGYAVVLNNPSQSTTCLSVSGCTYHPHYEQWGRAATQQPAPK